MNGFRNKKHTQNYKQKYLENNGQNFSQLSIDSAMYDWRMNGTIRSI